MAYLMFKKYIFFISIGLEDSLTFVHKSVSEYSCWPTIMSILPFLYLILPPVPASVPYCSDIAIALPKLG